MTSPAETPLDGDGLAALVAQQLEVLQQLQRLAQQQQELIAETRISELLSLLAHKQQLLERLGSVQQALRPSGAQPAAAPRWASPQQQQRCRRDAAQCDALLAEILQLESHSETALAESRDALGARLQQSAGALHAAQVYRSSPSPGARPAARLDLSSGR